MTSSNNLPSNLFNSVYLRNAQGDGLGTYILPYPLNEDQIKAIYRAGVTRYALIENQGLGIVTASWESQAFLEGYVSYLNAYLSEHYKWQPIHQYSLVVLQPDDSSGV